MKTDKEIIEELAKNPKIIKAMKGLLSPLEKEGDTLTIRFMESEK